MAPSGKNTSRSVRSNSWPQQETVAPSGNDNSAPAKTKSWLASFQKPVPLPETVAAMPATAAPVSVDPTTPTTAYSRMSHALDSAKKMLYTSSSSPPPNNALEHQYTPWMTMPSPSKMSTAVYSMASTTLSSFNSFSFSPDAGGSSDIVDDNNNGEPASHFSRTSHNRRRRRASLLPRLASQFEWAPYQHASAYQAVIGRGDAAAYLSSPRLMAWTRWLPSWIASNPHGQLSILSSGDGVAGDNDKKRIASWRDMIGGHHTWRTIKKSPSSEASMQAVKDLVSLVQQRIPCAEEDNESSSGHGHHSRPTQSTLNQPQPPLAPPQQLETIAESQQSSNSLDSADCEPPIAMVEALPKTSASNPLISPISSRRIRPSSFNPNDKTYDNSLCSVGNKNAPLILDDCHLGQNMHAEMAARLAEGTLRA